MICRQQILLVQSFSKPYAMTGWRMGYLLSDASIKERLALLHQFMVVSTPAPFQTACIRALDCDITPMLEIYRTRRDYVLRRLQQMQLPACSQMVHFTCSRLYRNLAFPHLSFACG